MTRKIKDPLKEFFLRVETESEEALKAIDPKTPEEARRRKEDIAGFFIRDGIKQGADIIYVGAAAGGPVGIFYAIRGKVVIIAHENNRPGSLMEQVDAVDCFKRLVGINTPKESGRIYRHPFGKDEYVPFKVSLEKEGEKYKLTLERIYES